MSGEEMKRFRAIAFFSVFAWAITGVCAASEKPRYDSKLVAETRAFVAAIPKVLKQPSLPTLTEHSKWGNSIVERSNVFLGSQSDLSRAQSPYAECHKAAYWAREYWNEARTYEMRPHQAAYKGMQLFKSSYEASMRYCMQAKD